MNNSDKEVTYRSVNCMTVKWQMQIANALHFKTLSCFAISCIGDFEADTLVQQ